MAQFFMFFECSNAAANWTVNQRRETWKSLDCGHSSEVVWLEMEVLLCRKKEQFLRKKLWIWHRNNDILSVEKSQVTKNVVDLNASQTFNGFLNIIFLWGLCLLFCLLADLIPFLSKHVGGAASNQLTNRPQTSWREVISWPSLLLLLWDSALQTPSLTDYMTICKAIN